MIVLTCFLLSSVLVMSLSVMDRATPLSGDNIARCSEPAEIFRVEIIHNHTLEIIYTRDTTMFVGRI